MGEAQQAKEEQDDFHRVLQRVLDHVQQVIPLPHPSWRNTHWLKKNPWFETELLPVLRARVSEVMKHDPDPD